MTLERISAMFAAVAALQATDEMAAFQRLAAMLSVQSLDLRAEYEAKLRILTYIQREIETLRSAGSATQRQRALDQLQKRFNELAAANREASETLKMIRAEFERVLPRRLKK
jgi:hypothetical protein